MGLIRHARALVCAATMAFVGVAGAAPVTYDITVSGNWFDSFGNPFGMSFSPTLNGSITVDNTIAGIAGMLDFTLTTGSKTWTEADFFNLASSPLSYDASGNLISFDLNAFIDGFAVMAISTQNRMIVSDGNALNACNDCVSFVRASAVPEPASLSLVGLALFAAVASRRRV